MQTADLYEEPSIVMYKLPLEAKGYDFYNEVSRGFNRAVLSGVPQRAQTIIAFVAEYIQTLLADRPAKTGAGRVVRWLAKNAPRILRFISLFKK